MTAPDTAAGGSAAGTRCAPPCTLVIFGAGGDLTKRLLIPSVYNLACAHLLPDTFSIIGVDIVQQDDAAWRGNLTAAMQSFTTDKTAEAYTPELNADAWKWVGDRLHYLSGDFKDPATFDRLQQSLGGGSAIFYLAVAARFFTTVVEGLGKAQMFKESDAAFRHLVIEKPFGSDLPSAQALNAAILAQADESQVYRIDHFLGKETVQSIMAVRFGNGMFEPTWRREYIDHVQITAAETVGVEMRGSFYEPTGALRDMVPNHLFTLLSMVAMDPPNSFDADDVRTEKSRVAKAMRPVQPADAVRGQYESGTEAGKPVVGYRQEPNVSRRAPPRPMWPSRYTSRIGAGRACRFICGPANAWRDGARKSRFTTSPLPTACFATPASMSSRPTSCGCRSIPSRVSNPIHGQGAGS